MIAKEKYDEGNNDEGDSGISNGEEENYSEEMSDMAERIAAKCTTRKIRSLT